MAANIPFIRSITQAHKEGNGGKHKLTHNHVHKCQKLSQVWDILF